MRTLALPSPGPQGGRDGEITSTVLGDPNAHRRDKITSGELTPAGFEAEMRAKWLDTPDCLGFPTPSGGTT